MSKKISKKDEFKLLKINCEDVIEQNILNFNTSLKILKEKLALLENTRKEIVEKNILDVQKKLDVLEERDNLKFNQNQIENILVDSIKINSSLKKESYSSGLFNGIIYGFVFSAMIFSSILFYIVQKEGISITKDFFTNSVEYNSIISSISFGYDPMFVNIGFGIMFFLIMSLSISLSIYSENASNLKRIKKYRETIGEFELQVGDKQILISDLNDHFDKYLKALKIFQALLSEESGKLDRVIFFIQHPEIEETQIPVDEINNVKEMLIRLDDLISTPIFTDDGLISVDSIGSLNKSVEYLNIYVNELYSK